MNNLAQRVKDANRNFYDIVGESYEEIDGRRSEQLIHYAEDKLGEISKKTEANSILDLGCGSGFISRVARNYFKQRYALDISHRIVRGIDDVGLYKVIADTDVIPFKDNSMDCVVSFAVLHHCYSYEKILSEICRVLVKGGIFYSDHDMDSLFFRRYRPLLKIYRKVNDARSHYLSRFSQLSSEMYHCSEYHEDGIPSEAIELLLKNAGFSDVRLEYHWFGLSPLTDNIFGKKSYKKGYAPLVRIIAAK